MESNINWLVGEVEVKFYLDGDDGYSTIADTGTEGCFGGAWNFGAPGQLPPGRCQSLFHKLYPLKARAYIYRLT
ncbi:MAG: DUF2961 domain-containing protein [Christensenellales bacterium]